MKNTVIFLFHLLHYVILTRQIPVESKCGAKFKTEPFHLPQRAFVFHNIRVISSRHSPLQHSPVCLCNRRALCSL
jgi:hypothetical protein